MARPPAQPMVLRFFAGISGLQVLCPLKGRAAFSPAKRDGSLPPKAAGAEPGHRGPCTIRHRFEFLSGNFSFLSLVKRILL